MYSLFNDDCVNVLKTIPSQSINFILIDPPYGTYVENSFTNGGNEAKFSTYQQERTWDKNFEFKEEIVREFHRILKKNGSLFCFYDIYKIGDLKSVLEKYKFKQFRTGIWSKTNPVPVNSEINYLNNADENFIFCVKGSGHTFNSKYDNAIYKFPICHGHERTSHPTQKPLALIKAIIEKHSNEGDTILDAFMGSGTTGVGCVELNRNFIGIEIDRTYFKLSTDRIQKTYKNIDRISIRRIIE